MDTDAQREWFGKGLEDADYDARMSECGFTQMCQKFNQLVPIQDVAKWATLDCVKRVSAHGGTTLTFNATSVEMMCQLNTYYARLYQHCEDVMKPLVQTALVTAFYRKCSKHPIAQNQIERCFHPNIKCKMV